MRGSPLLRALIAFLLIAAMGWPLWRLTHRRPVVAAKAESTSAAARIALALDFTAPPQRIVVTHLGREIWSASEPPYERELTLPWPAEGIDLRFTIAWPDDAPLAAARIRITAPDGRELQQTLWSRGPADEVLTFR